MELLIYTVVTIGVAVFFIVQSKKKSKLGLNFKRVYCPACNEKQPIIRIPRGKNQILYGGTTCPKCNASLDKYGDIIS
jgi:ssDNA-binding Zn-finger/Zn-ribbon topoisomerase 1